MQITTKHIGERYLRCVTIVSATHSLSIQELVLCERAIGLFQRQRDSVLAGWPAVCMMVYSRHLLLAAGNQHCIDSSGTWRLSVCFQWLADRRVSTNLWSPTPYFSPTPSILTFNVISTADLANIGELSWITSIIIVLLLRFFHCAYSQCVHLTKGKKAKVAILVIALLTWVRDQKRFTISEVAADRHELIPQRTIAAIHCPRQRTIGPAVWS